MKEYAKIEDGVAVDVFRCTWNPDFIDPSEIERLEKHRKLLDARVAEDGVQEITGQDVRVGDETPDGGATWTVREPRAKDAFRALTKLVKDLYQASPGLTPNPQAIAVIQRFKNL